MFSRDEMQRAIEDALKTMEGVALELYRRGREPLLEELETVKRERDEARALVDQLGTARDKGEAELRDLQRSTSEALAQALEWQRERDEARREADRFRHGCTVEGDFVCPNEYAVGELTAERNFLRALKKNHEEDFTRVCKERDEARAEVERLREMAHDFEAMREDRDSAYRRGAEAMREHIAEVAGRNAALEWVVELVLVLPIPEET